MTVLFEFTRVVYLVTGRASLFTDHEISGRPIRAKYRHFTTICETSDDVLVALVTSIYFSGIGNDASLGTYIFTLGST